MSCVCQLLNKRTYDDDDDTQQLTDTKHCPSRNHAIRYNTRCYFNVRSKADTSQVNLPHAKLRFFLLTDSNCQYSLVIKF